MPEEQTDEMCGCTEAGSPAVLPWVEAGFLWYLGSELAESCRTDLETITVLSHFVRNAL